MDTSVVMYADFKKIPLEDIIIELKHDKIHAEDCQKCEAKKAKIDQIEKRVILRGGFSPEQEKRLYEIAEKCPVNKTLQSEVKIVSLQGEDL